MAFMLRSALAVMETVPEMGLNSLFVSIVGFELRIALRTDSMVVPVIGCVVSSSVVPAVLPVVAASLPEVPPSAEPPSPDSPEPEGVSSGAIKPIAVRLPDNA